MIFKCKSSPMFFLLLDTMIVVSNMRYFNVQGLAFEHRLEEQTINHALHHEQVVGLHEDVDDRAFVDMHKR